MYSKPGVPASTDTFHLTPRPWISLPKFSPHRATVYIRSYSSTTEYLPTKLFVSDTMAIFPNTKHHSHVQKKPDNGQMRAPLYIVDLLQRIFNYKYIGIVQQLEAIPEMLHCRWPASWGYETSHTSSWLNCVFFHYILVFRLDFRNSTKGR